MLCCSSNTRDCDDYFDTITTVFTHFCPVQHTAVLVPFPFWQHRVSPLCRAVQTDGWMDRQYCCRRFHHCWSISILSGTSASLLKSRSLDAYTPADKTFQSSPCSSPKLNIGRRAYRAAHPTPGTSTRAEAHSPLP